MFDSHDEKIVLLDMNVQRDIFHPAGSLYTAASGAAYRNILRLFGWVEARSVSVLSTILLNRPGRRGPFSPIPHCIECTEGELKMPGTYLGDCINLGNAHTADLQDNLMVPGRQLIFETRDYDPFRHQKFDRLICELPNPADYLFVICGASLSCGVKQAVLGLRAHDIRVAIAADAVASLDFAQTEMDWLKCSAKGAEIVSVSELTRPECLRAGSCSRAAAS